MVKSAGKEEENLDHLKEVGDYWDQRSEGFSDAINEEADSYVGEEWAERFKKALGDDSLEILDDGAGAGFFSIILSRLGHKVTSIDYSKGMGEHLIENMKKRGLEPNAMQMDAQALEFADESFDAVTSNYVYHNIHSTDKQELLLESLRVLKKGGCFAIHDIMGRAYGDMEDFAQKLKDMGYEEVKLIKTDDGKFMTSTEAKIIRLNDSTLLVGKK